MAIVFASLSICFYVSSYDWWLLFEANKLCYLSECRFMGWACPAYYYGYDLYLEAYFVAM